MMLAVSGKFTFAWRRPYSFSDLSFGVPGGIVQIAGTYDVKELLDFHGHLLLDASLADTTSGFKAVYGDNGSTHCSEGGAAVRSCPFGSPAREIYRQSGWTCDAHSPRVRSETVAEWQSGAI